MRKIFFFLLIYLYVSFILITKINMLNLIFTPFNKNFNRAVPRMILYTRIVNLVLSVCMIIASLLSLLTTENATTGVLACYVMVFSCLLCCFEVIEMTYSLYFIKLTLHSLFNHSLISKNCSFFFLDTSKANLKDHCFELWFPVFCKIKSRLYDICW
jgi:hypothetical protein